ncbi:endonuclease/exonuclease/phosphatase family protein [Flavicella sp.]|uniref:endonuclease/exonuclease/phosphatase family protein n=1 Tax=Flavicella sp. TaxID=2957742 RepID=UPI00301B678E
MKNNSFFDKLVFFLNSIIAFLLLTSYLIPYIQPKVTSIISVLSLGMPVLIILNTVFLVFWIVKLKRQFLLSLIILAIGIQHVNAFIQFGKNEFTNNNIKIMSYNVRMFNAYKSSDGVNIKSKILSFIKKENPDVIAIQEHYHKHQDIPEYQHSYVDFNRNNRIGLGIYSKYKIINKGSLSFKQTGNNSVYADIVINSDTLRIYNLHLESLRIDTNKDNFGQKNSEKLLKRFESTFAKQEAQVKKIIEHSSNCKYRTIFMGDFNNTAFSWVYKQLKQNKKDAFIEAGNGFGKSYNFIFPFRIDFILTDNSIEVTNFKTYNVKYSDHFPLMAQINLSKN